MRLFETLKNADRIVFRHQLDFVTDVLLAPKFRVLLADDVGLGKTVQAALLIRLLLDEKRANRVLIVVPRAVLDHWKRELKRFSIKAHEIESPSFSLNHTVHIVTMDRAKKPEYLRRLTRQRWDLVVVDEAHRLRPGRKRWRLGDICMRARGCLLLTATPHTGNTEHYMRLVTLTEGTVIRREKSDVEGYEGRRIFPRLVYWVSYVRSDEDKVIAEEVLKTLDQVMGLKPIVLAVAKKRALSSPIAFLKTLSKVAGGEDCDPSGGELDTCLGKLTEHPGLKALAEKYRSARDGKLEALRALLDAMKSVGWKKVVVFTEYATTAEYLFKNLASWCNVVEEGDGYGRAYCDGVGIMYADYKARSRWEELEKEVNKFANSYDSTIFISTDIMSEGIDLHAFNAVVNYEVVWSPTKHMQRIGRIWRLGQKAGEVLVVDLVDSTQEREYYDLLMEKFYEISRVALVPVINSRAVEIYGISEDGVRKLVEMPSAPVYISEVEAFDAVAKRDIEKLRKKVEQVLKVRHMIKRKSHELVERGLRVKLGLGGSAPEPGEYYLTQVRYYAGNMPLYSEYILADERSNLYRGAQIEQIEIEELGDAPKAAVSQAVERAVNELREYVSSASKYVKFLLGSRGLTYAITSVKRVRVKPRRQSDLEEQTATVGFEKKLMTSVIVKGTVESNIEEGVGKRDVEPTEPARKTVSTSTGQTTEERDWKFWAEVEQMAEESEVRHRVELAAVECAKRRLRELGYEIRRDYISVQRPFDMVVKKGDELYLLEVKGKSADRKGEPIVFTSSEVALARQSPDRYLIYIAYVDGDRCVEEVGPVAFAEFEREWELRRGEVAEYHCVAVRREGGGPDRPSGGPDGC